MNKRDTVAGGVPWKRKSKRSGEHPVVMHTSHARKVTIKLSVRPYREKFSITFLVSNSSLIDALTFSNQLFSNCFLILCLKITRNMFSFLLSAFDTFTVSGGAKFLVESDSNLLTLDGDCPATKHFQIIYTY